MHKNQKNKMESNKSVDINLKVDDDNLIAKAYSSNSSKRILLDNEKLLLEDTSKMRANSCTMSQEVKSNILLNFQLQKIKDTFDKFKNRTNEIGMIQRKEIYLLDSSKKPRADPANPNANFHYALGVLSTIFKIQQKRVKLSTMQTLGNFDRF